MEIDIKTFLLVSMVVVGVVFVVLVANYSLFDSNSYEESMEVAEEETSLASTQNTAENKISDTDNAENNSDINNPINSMVSVSTEEEPEGMQEELNNQENTNIENSMQKPFSDSLIDKNNTSPKRIFYDTTDKYIDRTIRYSYLNPPCTLFYMVPESWDKKQSLSDTDPITGAYIRTHTYTLSDFGNYNKQETTYEEFLNDFIEYDRTTQEMHTSNIIYGTRYLVLSDNTEYPIIEKDEYYSVSNFMVFVGGENVVALEITAGKDDYTEEYIKRIDNIFSSTSVYFQK